MKHFEIFYNQQQDLLYLKSNEILYYLENTDKLSFMKLFGEKKGAMIWKRWKAKSFEINRI